MVKSKRSITTQLFQRSYFIPFWAILVYIGFLSKTPAARAFEGHHRCFLCHLSVFPLPFQTAVCYWCLAQSDPFTRRHCESVGWKGTSK